MKKIILLLFALVLIVGCKKQTIYEIPKDANGNVLFTSVSTTSSTGLTTLDAQFTVVATLPNAKSGDVMNVQCVQLQIPPGGTTTQLLPLQGTEKTVTVGADLKASVTYTRVEANLTKAGQYSEVVFTGKTDYAKQRVYMDPATTVSKPRVTTPAGTAKAKVIIVDVDVARTSEIANFWVTIRPKTVGSTSTLTVIRKNGKNGTAVTVPVTTFSGDTLMAPISGSDFAVGKDTMYYTFTAASGSFSEVISSTIIVRDPYFYLKKTATLTRGGSSAARNLLINAGTASSNNTAQLQISASGPIILVGGTAWLAQDPVNHTISFVPTTLATYTANNSTATIAEFAAGTPTTSANPTGAPAYIYKMVQGPLPSDVFYGLIKMGAANATDGTVTFEYRIGNLYAHLLVIK
jgi:hypothetical protein